MKTFVIGIILAVAVIVLFTPAEIEGMQANKQYVMFSDVAFLVFDTGANYTMTVLDGGMLYKEKWRMIDFEKGVEILPVGEKLDRMWINGTLDSGHPFWFTYRIQNNTVTETGIFAYDGETLYENYTSLFHKYILFY